MNITHGSFSVAFALLLATGGNGSDPQGRPAAAGEPGTVSASSFGFDPLDATRALQAAINSGARKVVVENMGTPWMVDPIQLAGDQELFFEKGVEVQARRGAFTGTNDCLFTAAMKSNITLSGYGATFRMWKGDYRKPEYKKSEWRHAVSLLSCTHVNIFGLTLAGSGGDGIYLGVAEKGQPNTEVHIMHVKCLDNYRQGISVISARNLLIERTLLQGTEGTAPQAGIDFEPNDPSQELANIVVRDCVSEKNQGSAYDFNLPRLTAQSPAISIRFENCTSHGCTCGVEMRIGNGKAEAVNGHIEFIDCIFDGSEYSGIMVNKPAGGCSLRFVRCEIKNAAVNRPAEAPLGLRSRSGDSEITGGIEFVDCTVNDPLVRRPLFFKDLSGDDRFGDVAGVTGTLTVRNTLGLKPFVLTPEVVDMWVFNKSTPGIYSHRPAPPAPN